MKYFIGWWIGFVLIVVFSLITEYIFGIKTNDTYVGIIAAMTGVSMAIFSSCKGVYHTLRVSIFIAVLTGIAILIFYVILFKLFPYDSMIKKWIYGNTIGVKYGVFIASFAPIYFALKRKGLEKICNSKAMLIHIISICSVSSPLVLTINLSVSPQINGNTLFILPFYYLIFYLLLKIIGLFTPDKWIIIKEENYPINTTCPTCGLIYSNNESNCPNCTEIALKNRKNILDKQENENIGDKESKNTEEKDSFVVCKNCGKKHKNPIDNLCNNCGRDMYIKDNYIKCIKCGQEYENTESKCPICGELRKT